MGVHEIDFGTITVWEIVVSAYRARMNGLIYFQSGKEERVFYFQHGQIVFARSNVVDERLGEQLLRWKRITYTDLMEAAQALQPGVRLGTILVSQGKITPDELVRSVVRQVREIVHAGFNMEEGRCRILKNVEIPEEVISLDIPMPLLIFEGILSISRWKILEQSVGPLNTEYEKGEMPISLVEELPFPREWLEWLPWLKTPRTVEEIFAHSPYSSFDTARYLANSVVFGLLKTKRPVITRAESYFAEGIDEDTVPIPEPRELLEEELDLDVSFSDLVDILDEGIAQETQQFLPRMFVPHELIETIKLQHRYVYTLFENTFGAEKAYHRLKQILERLKVRYPLLWWEIEPHADGELPWERLWKNCRWVESSEVQDSFKKLIEWELETLSRVLSKETIQYVRLTIDTIRQSLYPAVVEGDHELEVRHR